MRRSIFVADSVLSNISPAERLKPLVGEAGADFAVGCKSISVANLGKSRETVLFGRRVNIGKGRELGGGEFEQAVPAQLSEN